MTDTPYVTGVRKHLACAVIFSATLVTTTPVWAQDPNSNGIRGAWAEQSLKCDDVFTSKDGRMMFKQPANIFAPAFIITGKRLTTPQAVCRLKNVKAGADRSYVTLRCANSVSDTDVHVSFAKLPDGRLARYFDDKDQSGSRYANCSSH
jgi:hypothetical protein